VNNTSDENLLRESDQRQRIAEDLDRGIAAFLDRLQGLPEKKQKFVSRNRPITSSGLATSTAAIGRTPQSIR
jgi:hypothetical protein